VDRWYKIERRPGSWLVTVDRGKNAAGKRVRTCRTVHGDASAADVVGAEMYALTKPQRDRTVAGKMKFSDFAQAWLENFALMVRRGERSNATLERYQKIARDHLVPTLGMLDIGKVTEDDVRRAVATWRAMSRKDRKKGLLSERTVGHLLALTSSILEDARRQKRVLFNVARDVSVRKPEIVSHGVVYKRAGLLE